MNQFYSIKNTKFFTISDEGFLPRAVAMLESFRKFEPHAEVLLVTIGQIRDEIVSNLNHLDIKHTPIEDVIGESLNFELLSTRTYIEYLYALPSSCLKSILCNSTGFECLVYLDADLYFFSSPAPEMGKIASNKISVVPHNFSPRLGKIFAKSGTYNVSWVGVPRSEVGMRCAMEWASQCKSSTSASPQIIHNQLIYGDQGYLDSWPEKYNLNLHIIENEGFGTAPWNFESYAISNSFPIKINNQRLIFYHFSSHQFGFMFARKMGTEYSRIRKYPKIIYLEYENSLKQISKTLGFRNWKSRYRPLHRRILTWISREFFTEN